MFSDVILYVYCRYLLQFSHKFEERNKSFEFKVDSDTADSIIVVFSSG